MVQRVMRLVRAALATSLVLTLFVTIEFAAGARATSSSWRILAIPGNSEALAGVSCYSAHRCLGVSMGSSQVVTSEDGGRSWRALAGPGFARLGFTSLYCASTGRCLATAVWGNATPAGGLVAASADGGRHWRLLMTRRFPGNLDYRFNDVWCTSTAHCIVAGTNGAKGFVMLTTDAGRSWFPAHLPAQPIQGSIAAITCTTADECLATQAARAELYRSRDAGRTWSPVYAPSGFTPILLEHGVVTGLTAISCGSVSFCVTGGYIAHTQLQSTTEPFKWVSTDGGRTWSFDQPFAVTGAKSPAAISNGAIACQSSRVCTLGLSYGNIYSTRDAGAIWQRDDGAPHLDSNVLALSCPTTTHCVAAVISNFPSRRLLQGSIWITP